LILRAILAPHGDLVIDVDVPGKAGEERPPREERPREAGRERRDDRPRSGDRGDRGDRGPRRDDRGDRGPRRDDRRGPGGGGRFEDRPRREEERNTVDPDKLRALARRAAEKAIETGKIITIQLKLNSADRRLVHVEIQDMSGVSSRSEFKDGVKYVQVIPDSAAT
jgi:hypothetical protein